MNYQGNNKLVLSIGTVLLIVVALLVIFATTPDARPALSTLSGIIVLMAVLSVVFAYEKYKRVKERVSKLPKDFQMTYLDIYELLGTYTISKFDRQNILAMILEIFEHASLDQRTVDDVIGGNLASFVDSFANETGKSQSPGYLFVYSTSLFLGFLLLIKVYKVIRTGSITLAALNNETLDIGIVAAYFIISYVFFPWLTLSIRKSTRQQWQGAQKLRLLIPMFIPVGLMMALIIINDPAWRSIIDRPLPLFASPLSLVLGILILFGALLLTRLHQR